RARPITRVQAQLGRTIVALRVTPGRRLPRLPLQLFQLRRERRRLLRRPLLRSAEESTPHLLSFRAARLLTPETPGAPVPHPAARPGHAASDTVARAHRGTDRG